MWEHSMPFEPLWVSQEPRSEESAVYRPKHCVYISFLGTLITQHLGVTIQT